ncbi:MAG: sulfotransferase [Terriglobales bacterium]
MRPPVFIVGCPRSGTSFLYHLLLSAGGFARFHTQMNVFDVLGPIFGDLSSPTNKKKMMQEWLRSKAFAVSGLEANEIEARVMAECRNGSDFMRIVMEEIARKQSVDRWIDSTPTNIPHMLRIGRDFPDARFIHIIRDARDVALSLDKRHWSRPLPWDKKRSLLAAGLYWEWIVRKGRKNGATLGASYMEVNYEELVERPEPALKKIGEFLQHELDYARIQETSVGSVKKPLTSFKEDLKEGHFTPVGRWKNKFPVDQLKRFEQLVGNYLQELGYPLSDPANASAHSLAVRKMRWTYRAFYDFKQWAKVNTPLSRWMVSYSDILIDK